MSRLRPAVHSRRRGETIGGSTGCAPVEPQVPIGDGTLRQNCRSRVPSFCADHPTSEARPPRAIGAARRHRPALRDSADLVDMGNRLVLRAVDDRAVSKSGYVHPLTRRSLNDRLAGDDGRAGGGDGGRAGSGIRGGSLGPAWRRLGTCSALSRGTTHVPRQCAATRRRRVCRHASATRSRRLLPVGHRMEGVRRQYLCLTAGGGTAGGRAPCEGQ
jgi:hypothetical protein